MLNGGGGAVREHAMRSLWLVCALGVCATIGAASAYAALPSPVVGAEIATDTPVLKASDLGHNPALASDGSGFLAVQEVNSRIRAVRVDGAGTVLDSPWLDLGEASADQYYPSVTFGGGHYLVTWSAFVHDGSSTIEGRFVKPDGSVEGSANLTLASSAMYPSVGWNGTRFFLSYLQLNTNDANVSIASFNADGSPIAGSAHALSAPGSIAYPRITVGPSAAFVAWESYVHDDVNGDVGHIRGSVVDASGVPSVAGEFLLSAKTQGEASVSVASSGNGFLAVWNTTDSPSVVLGTLVDTSGVIKVKDVPVSHSSEDSGLPSVAFDGSNYLVAWADGRDEQSVYGVRVSQAGVVAATTDVKLATGSPRYVTLGSDRTALAWNGSKFLLSFLGHGIEGSLLAQNLSISNGQIALTGVPNKQSYPSSAWTGENYLVSWTDERNSDIDMDVRGVRIGVMGQLLDPLGIAFSTAQNPGFSAQLASTRQGPSLLVWFGSTGASYERTMQSDGTLGAVKPFQTEPLNSGVSLAGNGTGYLAAYQTGDSSDGAVFGRVLDVNGGGSATFKIDSSTVNTGPTVFADGSDYLVSYSKSGMRLVPVSGSGALGQSVPLSSSIAWVTAASSAPGSTLVIWSDVNDTKVLGRFFKAGALSGPTLTLSDTSAGYGAAVAWDGTSFWAVWETPEHLLQARSIGTDGTLGALSNWVDQECFAPVLASDGQGQLLLSYTKYLEQSQSRRVFSRLVGRGAVEPSGGAAGASGSTGAAGNAGNAGTSAGSGGGGGGGSGAAGAGSGGRSSGGASAAGSPSSGGAVASGGAAGSGTPVPPKCSVSAPGVGTTAPNGFMIWSLGFVVARIWRRQRKLAA